jgi:hemin uptake protein HemP
MRDDRRPRIATPAVPPPVRAEPRPQRRVTSGELFGTARELVIVHAESEYRLRLTRTNKLILTK